MVSQTPSRRLYLVGWTLLLYLLVSSQQRRPDLARNPCGFCSGRVERSSTPTCPSVHRGRAFSQNQTEFYVDFGGNDKRYSYHSYLNATSTVMEIGGYTGVDITALRERYGMFRVFIFEPIFYREATKTFEDVENVEIFAFGVGASTRKSYFNLDGVGSKPSSNNEGVEVEIRNFNDVLASLKLTRIDLLQINCEGCEWEVLEMVLRMHAVFEHIQVQFHPGATWVSNRLERYAAIQDALAKRYLLVYDVPWIWQMWSPLTFQTLALCHTQLNRTLSFAVLVPPR
mmetsp:Transcript_12368/g.53188  ORF Transcript_12368/g.53188 Transcript_12368/m.53188 type:complete len:285 (+) Transcript_12368:115-969(+)